jgi:FkbM family methyltransferase
MKYMKHYYPKFDMFKTLFNKNNPVIIEVGAHYGEDSLRFSEAFEQAKIYCFEPDPRNIKIFKKYVNKDNIKLFECALSNKSGEQEFFQSYDETQTSSVPSKYDWISLTDYQKNLLSNSGSSSLKRGYNKVLSKSIIVKTQRFDQWYDENSVSDIDLMWIDVQGAEKEVLEGIGNKIKNIKFIWLEYGEKEYTGALTALETILLLRSKNFEIKENFPTGENTGDLLFYNTKNGPS